MRHFFNKTVQYYFYDLKLSYKLMITYWVLLALPTLIVTFFLYGQIYDIIISNTIHSNQLSAEQTAETLDATLSVIANTSSLLLNDPFLDELSSYKAQSQDSGFTSEQTASFLSSVNTLLDNSLISDIRIYLDTPFASLYETDREDSIFLPMLKAAGSYWYGIFQSTDTNTLLCPGFYLSPRENMQYGNMALIRELNYTGSRGQTAAYAVVYFNRQHLDTILRQSISVQGSVAYIVNRRSNLVSSSDSALSGTYFMDYDTLINSIKLSNTMVSRYVLSQKIYTGYYPIRNTDWFLVNVIPAKPLLQKSSLMILRFIGFYIFFLLIAFMLAYMLSHSISNRISSVIKIMRKVRSGRLYPLSVKGGMDEIGDLIETYNYMTARINALMQEREKAAESLRHSEFKALQAQINPHFLYNTLDMINWLAKSGQTNAVSDAVLALSGFYKITLKQKETMNTIALETEHVLLYVKIQNMRYHDSIKFIIDIPENLYDYEIPKLTFQPIVENAIQHGILETETKEGCIVLTGWQESEELIFLIADDGIGMEDAVRQNILSGKGSSQKGSNIGVYNTHMRLRLLYGEPYGLSYGGAPGIGTDVFIRIPARN